MRTFSLFLLLLCLFSGIQAQDTTYNEYLNEGKSPRAVARNFDWRENFYFGGGGGILVFGGQGQGILPMVSLAPRINLKEFSDNRSLSIASNAGFIIQFSNFGNYLALYAPLMVEYNMGHMATRMADFPVGIGLGLGAEYLGANFSGERLRHWAGIGSAALYFTLGGGTYYIRASKSLTYSNGLNTTYLSLGNMF